MFRFTDGQLAIIKSLACQEGVAVVCPGFETDGDRRIDILSPIGPMRDEDFRTATLEQLVLRSDVMFAFGTHFGAGVAIGKADLAVFCALAHRSRPAFKPHRGLSDKYSRFGSGLKRWRNVHCQEFLSARPF